MSDLALAGWGLLLKEELPRIVAQLALALGMAPGEILQRLTPAEAALLFQELSRSAASAECEGSMGESPSRDAAMLMQVFGE